MAEQVKVKTLKLYDEYSIPEKLTDKDLAVLVDDAVKLQEIGGLIGERLALIKDTVKGEAAKRKLPRNTKGECIIKGSGNNHIMLVDSTEPLDIAPRDLYRYLKEHGQKSYFWGFVKCKITELKQALGEREVIDIAGGEPEVKPYNKCYIKAK